MNWIAVPLAGLTVVSTLAGGYVALRLHRELTTLIALTGGVVVGVALFDVLPEAIDAVGNSGRVTGLVGARLPLLLPRRAGPRPPPSGRAGAGPRPRPGRRAGRGGLSLHSFIDGLGIGLAFGVNTTTGLLVFVAVVSHDFADGMNTVSFILSQSDNRRKAMSWLAVDAIAPLIGAIVGASISVSEYRLGYLLALYAGFFLFMGATDLLPEAHQHPSRLRVALTAAGFVAIYLVSVATSGVAELARCARQASCAATTSTRTRRAAAASPPEARWPPARRARRRRSPSTPMTAAARHRTFP